MHAVIRLFPTMKDVEKAGTLAETGLGPILKEQPGFRGYYVVRLDQGGGSISLFDTAENARAAHERSLDWIKENLAPMTGGAAPPARQHRAPREPVPQPAPTDRT